MKILKYLTHGSRRISPLPAVLQYKLHPPHRSIHRTIPTLTSSEMMLTTAQGDMQF